MNAPNVSSLLNLLWFIFQYFNSTIQPSLVCCIHCHSALSWVLCSYFSFNNNISPYVLEHLLDLSFGSKICLHLFVLNYIYFLFCLQAKPLKLSKCESSKGCLIIFPILLFNFIALVIVKPIVNLIWIIFTQLVAWCVVSQMHFWEFLSCFLLISKSGQNDHFYLWKIPFIWGFF